MPVFCLFQVSLEHYFAGRYIGREAQKAFFRNFIGKINFFLNISRRTSNLILRPITKSSLKLKKANGIHGGFGHAFGRCGFKLK